MANFNANCGIPIGFKGFLNARMPQDVFVFFDDFIGPNINATADAAVWDSTLVAQAATGVSIMDGTDAYQNLAGGILVETTEASAGDGENFQVNGLAFQIIAGYPLYFETRLRVLDVTNSKMFIGLTVVDATCMAAMTYAIGFRMAAAGSGTIEFLTESNTSEKETTIMTAAEATAAMETAARFIRLAFFYDGYDTIIATLCDLDNGVFKIVASRKLSVTADYVPSSKMMTPTMEFCSDSTASAETYYVDYILCMQQRYPITRPV